MISEKDVEAYRRDGVIVVPAAEARQTLPRALAVQEDEANRRRALLEGSLA